MDSLLPHVGRLLMWIKEALSPLCRAPTAQPPAHSPLSPVDPVPGGETLPVALHEVHVVLRSVEGSSVGEEPVEGRPDGGRGGRGGRGGGGGGCMALGHGAARPARHSPAAAGAQGQQGQRPREHRRGPVSAWEVLPPHPAAARPDSSFSHPAAILRDCPVLQRRQGEAREDSAVDVNQEQPQALECLLGR